MFARGAIGPLAVVCTRTSGFLSLQHDSIRRAAAEKMLLPYEPINVLTTMLMAPLIMSPAIIPALYHGTKSFKEKLPKTAFFQHAVAGVVV
jgi:hypothetical protein